MIEHPIAFRIGAIFGAAVVGILFGLIPFFLAKKQNRLNEGWIAFGFTLAGGLVMGIKLALPVSLAFSLYIYLTKKLISTQ